LSPNEIREHLTDKAKNYNTGCLRLSVTTVRTQETVGLIAMPLLYESGHVPKLDVPKWHVPMEYCTEMDVLKWAKMGVRLRFI